MTDTPRPELAASPSVIIAFDELAQLFRPDAASDLLARVLAVACGRRIVLDELSRRAPSQYATLEEFVAGHGA